MRLVFFYVHKIQLDFEYWFFKQYLILLFMGNNVNFIYCTNIVYYIKKLKFCLTIISPTGINNIAQGWSVDLPCGKNKKWPATLKVLINILNKPYRLELFQFIILRRCQVSLYKGSTRYSGGGI